MQALALSFSHVDDWAFTTTRGAPIIASVRPVIDGIGPLMELTQLARRYPALKPQLTALIERHALAPMVTLRERNHLVEVAASTGILQLADVPLPETERTHFSIRAKAAALAAGFAARTASQLTAAMLEMLDNIIEHSRAEKTGRIAYQAREGRFTFVVADSGIGALASLQRNRSYSHLGSDQEALPLVLQDGTSRHPDAGRGKGFNDLFRGLADHKGDLRFRSGAAAVLIDGHSPNPLHPKVKTKPTLDGFFASVTCAP